MISNFQINHELGLKLTFLTSSFSEVFFSTKRNNAPGKKIEETKGRWE